VFSPEGGLTRHKLRARIMNAHRLFSKIEKRAYDYSQKEQNAKEHKNDKSTQGLACTFWPCRRNKSYKNHN
jgi:hypothetical protein